ncbi:hypothetical protein AKJ57_06635 [candidate division MSBL1 archaeon SCGC-AAA259A05]|uniref:Carbohydrate kinase FGGY N-terminal domain-containing protein n=1 Tax=candidate division MSBL1 archaeon SCGC-AAA259A05 TaxID=1698259 RepID=A0A133U341_9EURY|nr:hypothetical protein AKJ57_06635 [candidate division MSBL1 archaeon SCGC-AAA259A05]
MRETHLVGIDLGTSGVRTTAYNTRGVVVGSGEAPLEEQSQEDWEEALRKAMPELPKGDKICSVDGTSGTVILADASGKVVFPPQMYYESAPEKAERVNEFASAREIRDKGVSISATSPIPKILRLKEEEPGKFEEVKWILSPTTWLLYRLKCGGEERWRELETDWTNALKLGADITGRKPNWFEPLFRDAGISLDLLPEVEGPGTPMGSAGGELAEKLGLGGAELYQGLTDGNSSALAMGCLEPGDYGISCGSTSVPKFVSEDIRPHEALYYHKHPIRGYLAGAAIETGMILKWICEKVLGVSQEKGLELARKVRGEEYGFFPQGDRSPFFDSRMGNTLTGIWPNQDLSKKEARGRLVRGIATGIAMEEYIYIPLLEEIFAVTIDRVNLLGGGAPSEEEPFSWWNELRASIWNKKTIEMEPRTTVGSLIPAALSSSLFSDASEASKNLLKEEGEIKRDKEMTDSYKEERDEFFDLWKEIKTLYDGRNRGQERHGGFE